MILSTLLLALVSPPDLTVEIIDSRDNPKITYVIVGDCKVKVDKAELHDYDEIIKKVMTICKIH